MMKKIKNRLRKWFNRLRLPFEARFLRNMDALRPKHTLDKPLIISLKSYHARFKTLPLTLRCILSQTMKPDEVVLWIGHADRDKLTPEILELQKYGLRIAYCEDIRSYTKIIPALREDSERYVLTVDDDLYYPADLVERLVFASKKHPGNVVANRTHRIRKDEEGMALPYQQWKKRGYDNENPALNFLTGVGGVLYPPGVFYRDVLNESLFRQLSPSNDDIWLYWMVRLQGRYIFNTETGFDIFTWSGTQETALIHTANHVDGNDIQFKTMIDHYGESILE